MQLMARDLTGQVEPAQVREYGKALLTVVHHGKLFAGLEASIAKLDEPWRQCI